MKIRYLRDSRWGRKDQIESKSLQDAADLVDLGFAVAVPRGEKKRLKKLKSFNDFLLAVERRDSAYLEKHYGSHWQASEPMTGSLSLKAALAESSGATGGYAVPQQYARQIMRLVIENSLLRPGAQIEPMSSKTLQVPLLDVTSVQSTGSSPFLAGLTWTWNAEAQTRTETEPQFKQAQLVANELGGQVILSRPVKDDGQLQGEALDAFLFTLFAEGISYYEDYNFLQGNGVGKPQGILNAAAALTVSRTNANQIGYADVSTMISKLPPSSFNDAFFLTHPTVFPQLLQLKDGASRAVVLTAGVGQSADLPPARPRHFIGNFPLAITEKLPALGTKGDLLLIDPRYYLIGDHTSGLRIDVSGEATLSIFIKNQLAYRVLKRVDGQPWLDKPITLQDGATQVSPFVILQ